MTLAMKMDMTNIGYRRSLSRLAAVQAVFQLSSSDESAEIVLKQFIKHRFPEELDGLSLREADPELFTDLVRGAHNRLSDIDRMIEAGLGEGWTMQRLDPVLLSILRCAAYELWCRPDIPAKVSIDQYVELAKDFFGEKEPKFVNSLLDQLAQKLRQSEMATAKSKK